MIYLEVCKRTWHDSKKKFERWPVEKLEENYKKLEFRLGEIQRTGTQAIRSKVSSNGLDSNPMLSNPVQSDSIQCHSLSNPIELNAIRADPIDSNPGHCAGSMPSQSNPSRMDRRMVDPPPRTLPDQVDYVMRQLECVNRHVTDLEQRTLLLI